MSQRAVPEAKFVDELWDVAIFTDHGIVRMRSLIDAPKFDRAYALAAAFLEVEEDDES